MTNHAWEPRAAFLAAERALAVPHRDDDQPCGCDECMAYGAEDEGADWYRFPPPNRLVIRALDSGDDRLTPLRAAFRDHEDGIAWIAPEPRYAGSLNTDLAGDETSPPRGPVVVEP